MGYLKEFQTQINNRDFGKLIELFEEYCTCDTADIEEVTAILKLIQGSEFAKPFGQYVESLLLLWETISSNEESYAILRLIVDIQTTNSLKLADLSLEALKKRYGERAEDSQKLRLVGLRTKENFQGALSNFDLLMHIKKGNFVFHAGGWGVGEIMEFSDLREQMSIEFENVSGMKQITFTNGFKSLTPIPQDHFLARRFSDADAFEKEAKEDPIGVIKCLLRDLGPKNAAEIKDELSELVIPEKDWQKWWQNARAKIKKDTEIQSPENLKDPFVLRKEAVTHESLFLESLRHTSKAPELLLACYNFIRDHASKLKVPEIKDEMSKRLQEILQSDPSPALKLQTYFSLESVSGAKFEAEIANLLHSKDLEGLIDQIDIMGYKKLALVNIKKNLPNWEEAFISLLKSCSGGLLKEYIIKELLGSGKERLLEKSLQDLLKAPWEDPEFFVWFYQKLMSDPEEGLPFSDKEGQSQFSEGFLILLHRIENSPVRKDLVKKMSLMLSNHRYALVRQIFQGSTLEFAKEFLLIASKCHTLTDHDLKIWRSLAEVVHPDLAAEKGVKGHHFSHGNVIWTTQEGYVKMQERIKHIGTKEIVDVAREIETARGHGDLRENAEYKYAQERRARLQGDLKTLSEQFSRARIITPNDITLGQVGIGSCVHAQDSQGERITLTILGPWEADPDNNILSYQSKAAQSMLHLHLSDAFKFKDKEYTITKISTIFDK